MQDFFETERGSVYHVIGECTKRFKMPHPNHNDYGVMKTSHITVYIDAHAAFLLEQSIYHTVGWPHIKDESISIEYTNGDTDNVIFIRKPKRGLHPLELWDIKDNADTSIPITLHVGSKIIDMWKEDIKIGQATKWPAF